MSFKIGIIADLHADLIPDGDKRLEKFLSDCTKEDVEFVIQLGDFVHAMNHEMSEYHGDHPDVTIIAEPTPADTKKVLDMYNHYEKPHYHVLGNHDANMSTRAEVMELWGMKEPWYSFDTKGWHFIVLDANYLLVPEENRFVPYENGRDFLKPAECKNYLPPQELAWLKSDLGKTDKPVMIFSHISLNNELDGIRNWREFRQIIKETTNQFVICVNGHNHIDNLVREDDVYYWNVNSSSYQWMGNEYAHSVYGKEIDAQYPAVSYMAMYEDSLYAIVEIDNDMIRIPQMSSKFIGKTPDELDFPWDFSECDVKAEIHSHRIRIYK